MTQRLPAPVLRAVGSAALLMLLGCDGSAGPALELAGGQTRLALSPPPVLQRAVDVNNLAPLVSINNLPVTLIRTDDDRWGGQAVVDEGSPMTVQVSWVETFNSRVLPLARYTYRVDSVTSDLSLSIGAEEYDTASLDADGDRVSNLSERIENTNPFDASDPGPDRAQVLVPHIDPERAPLIDGRFDPVWNDAQYLDRNRESLAIDNLMIDQGATRLNGDTEYQWAAMHDGVYLYLYVFGEAVSRRTASNDSSEPWQDDSVDIFVDADHSALDSYDGVDDFHLIIPLLKSGAELRENTHEDPDGRWEAGFYSAPVDIASDTDFAFHTCLCLQDRDTWEIRLSLEAFSIPVGATIGFEVQYNDDKNGGDREAKWGWYHPARIDADIDYTWRIPRYMGTLRLEPAIP